MDHPPKLLGRIEELDKQIKRLSADLEEAKTKRYALNEIVAIYDEYFAPSARDAKHG